MSSTTKSNEEVVVYNPRKLEFLAIHTINKTLVSNDLDYFQYTLPSTIYRNLKMHRRTYNYLCDSCFNALLDKCHSESIENVLLELYKLCQNYYEFCSDCVEKLKKSKEEYIKRITYLFIDKDYWDSYLENIMECRASDISVWDFKSLTLEQALILKNHPDDFPEFGDEYMDILTIEHMPTFHGKTYCSVCIGSVIKSDVLTPHFITATQRTKISAEDLAEKYLWNDSAWCSKCLYTPLFDFLDDDYDYYNLDVVYLNETLIRKSRFDITPSPSKKIKI